MLHFQQIQPSIQALDIHLNINAIICKNCLQTAALISVLKPLAMILSAVPVNLFSCGMFQTGMFLRHSTTFLVVVGVNFRITI